MPIDDRSKFCGDVIQRFIPADCHKLAALAHQGLRNRICKVVHPTRCAAFGTGVATRQRMVEVAPGFDDLLADDVEFQATIDHANSAIGRFLFDRLGIHLTSYRGDCEVMSRFQCPFGSKQSNPLTQSSLYGCSRSGQMSPSDSSIWPVDSCCTIALSGYACNTKITSGYSRVH